MGRNLKISFWPLNWGYQRTERQSCLGPDTRARRRGQSPGLPSWLSAHLTLRQGLFHQAWPPKWWIRSHGVKNALGDWCGFWLRLLCMWGSKREEKWGERKRDTDHQPARNTMSGREAGLVTDKAVNCERFHTGAWETPAQRGGCDPFGAGCAGVGYFGSLHDQTPGSPHGCSPVLRDVWCLPNLPAGSCVGKVMLWEPTVNPVLPRRASVSCLLFLLNCWPVSTAKRVLSSLLWAL